MSIIAQDQLQSSAQRAKTGRYSRKYNTVLTQIDDITPSYNIDDISSTNNMDDAISTNNAASASILDSIHLSNIEQ